jgi:hypothetical protein
MVYQKANKTRGAEPSKKKWTVNTHEKPYE